MVKNIVKTTIQRLISSIDYKLYSVAIVSFPKSGRTWLRFILGKYLQLYYNIEDNDFESLLERESIEIPNTKIPTIHFSHKWGNVNPFWTSPEDIKLDKKILRKSKIIFLARDPRDVVVSSFFEKKYRYAIYAVDKHNLPYKGDLKSYVYEKKGSFETVLTFYNSWIFNMSDCANFIIVRYEDLKNNIYREISNILNFINIDINEELLKEAVQFSRFENMKSIEKNQSIKSSRIQPLKIDDNNSYKVRAGKVGGYKEHLDQEEIAYMDQRISEHLTSVLGYW